ncbi:DUF692 domain-containing protein [Roseateles amylovorans]|uniref:DUF692 domain-containing protein n=1 Tax=Roseateles amylovorans TaxID=2978473 RepID=A0ABY6B6B6_9BURK|nr:DUF692 domain-containing protein [Roseateles amylovorans]UXH80291.1 DUF692 domain-containing protein [Roseateles amylovorans]
MSTGARLKPTAVGVGWRQPHYREVMATGADDVSGPGGALSTLRPARSLGVDFLEVHTENFLAAGGAARQMLLDASTCHSISLHGVGLGLGSACGLDLTHLRRIRELADQVRPVLMSEHACFARVTPGGQGAQVLHAQDLLPLPFSAVSLDLLVEQVQIAQDMLGRRLLIENLSACVAWADDHIPEPEFFNRLAQRSGCGLLLDLNNLYVNALNRGHAQSDVDVDVDVDVDADADADADALRAACAWVDAIDPSIVGEIHLAGHLRRDGLVIDDHGSRVCKDVWRLYAHALRRLGPRPTLIEWDTDVPPWSVLLDEVAQVRRAQSTLQWGAGEVIA